LEIALRAAQTPPASIPGQQMIPLNYVLVIDTSGSMEGEKLESVKASIRELFAKMEDNDFIGIIEFNEAPNTVLGAMRVEDVSDGLFGQLISNLYAGGGTDIAQGLQFGIAEIGHYGNDKIVNHIFLFSDGNPTSGETNWLVIRDRAASAARDKDVHISTFAFGSDANIRELSSLAGVTGGSSTFVSDPENIQIDLESDLNRREHLAGINVQVQAVIDQDIPIYYFYGHDLVKDPVTRAAVEQAIETAKEQAQSEVGVTAQPDIVLQEEGIRVFVPDLAFGETYWLVFEIAVPRGREHIGEAVVQYVDTVARENNSLGADLSYNGGTLESSVVTEHALGLWTSEVVFYALDDLYQEDVETAKARIGAHIARLESASDDLSSEQLRDDAITLEKFLSLIQNLGRIRNVSDEPVPNTQVFHTLNAFGRVRNGYNRIDHFPNP